MRAYGISHNSHKLGPCRQNLLYGIWCKCPALLLLAIIWMLEDNYFYLHNREILRKLSALYMIHMQALHAMQILYVANVITFKPTNIKVVHRCSPPLHYWCKGYPNPVVNPRYHHVRWNYRTVIIATYQNTDRNYIDFDSD